MSRGSSFIVPRDVIASDYIYSDESIAKLINLIMSGGKKQTASSIVYGALKRAKELLIEAGIDHGSELDVWNKALENSLPKLEVRSRRIGGATYSVPYVVKPKRARAMALRWFVSCALARKGLPMYKRLAIEIFDAHELKGAVIKKRDEVHKIAEANRAFAQYGW